MWMEPALATITASTSGCSAALTPHTHTASLSAAPSSNLLLYKQRCRFSALVPVRAEPEEAAAPDPAVAPNQAPSPPKQSILEALDFSAVRSKDDALLLDDARSAISLGEKMSPEQYAALRRKVGGTYRDFFKDYIEVDGEFVDEGWVDKSCRFCKKDTASEPRTVDKFGRYAHITCLEKSKLGNSFTRLFGM